MFKFISGTMMNTDTLTYLYRGPLSSCNYSCEYCPFSKKRNSFHEIESDRLALRRFVEHVECVNENRNMIEPFSRLSIMFIPQGEALVHDYYQNALLRLCRVPVIKTLAIQTNLSLIPSWITKADEKSKLSFWCTFHPNQIGLTSFLERIAFLERKSIRYCVGVVAKEEFYDTAMRLKAILSRTATCWANPLDDDTTLYTQESAARWCQFDPLFHHALKRRQTFATPCRCGDSVFTVSGTGDCRRCPFVEETLGNIYRDSLFQIRMPPSENRCPYETCPCFIGYIHWETPEFRRLYDGEPFCRIYAK